MSNLPMDMLLTKDIVREGEPILRTKVDPVCLPLREEDLQQMRWMMDYLKNSQNEELATRYDLRPGVGLSANQVGLNKRMCAVYYQDGDKAVEYALFNPKLVSHSTSMIYLEQGEGCLSVDRYISGYVPRYELSKAMRRLWYSTRWIIWMALCSMTILTRTILKSCRRVCISSLLCVNSS
jgi:peptide deformylase